jgi:hypothetical protein
MRRPAPGPRARALPALAALAVLAALAPGALAMEAPETVPVTHLEGVPCLSANELARLLDATRYWRADVRKLVLRSGNHRVVLTVDNPFVVVDERTLRLSTPVRSVRGELQIPVAMLEALPRDSAMAWLQYDPRQDGVVVLPPGGALGSPRLATTESVTRLSFHADRPEDIAVANRSREHFRVRFGGFFIGTLPDTLPRASLVRALRPIASTSGSAFELELSREAAGYRVIRESRPARVTIEFARHDARDLEAFAPEGAVGPRRLRVVVLDPGHGGDDAGVSVEGAVEKELTLALARQLRNELERRLPVRVVLTRDRDVALSVDQRAQAANQARADLVLSLHVAPPPTARPRSWGRAAPRRAGAR